MLGLRERIMELRQYGAEHRKVLEFDEDSVVTRWYARSDQSVDPNATVMRDNLCRAFWHIVGVPFRQLGQKLAATPQRKTSMEIWFGILLLVIGEIVAITAGKPWLLPLLTVCIVLAVGLGGGLIMRVDGKRSPADRATELIRSMRADKPTVDRVFRLVFLMACVLGYGFGIVIGAFMRSRFAPIAGWIIVVVTFTGFALCLVVIAYTVAIVPYGMLWGTALVVGCVVGFVAIVLTALRGVEWVATVGPDWIRRRKANSTNQEVNQQPSGLRRTWRFIGAVLRGIWDVLRLICTFFVVVKWTAICPEIVMHRRKPPVADEPAS